MDEGRVAQAEVYEDNEGNYRWRLVAGNGEIVATGAEGYERKAEAEASAYRLRDYVLTTPVDNWIKQERK